MKRLLSLTLVLLSCTSVSHAELFASSSNFIQTLTLAPGEAIVVSTVKYSESRVGSVSAVELTAVRSNKVATIPFFANGRGPQILAGPLQIQFQERNVFMEFQRLHATNLFSVIFDTNGVTIDVPSGKAINILPPTSWFTGYSGESTVLATLSNATTVVDTFFQGGEAFTGPLTITITPGSPFLGNTFTDGWVSYYITEEFATIPNLGATVVPAGKANITIEKSQDLTNWGTVFFSPVTQDQSAFYRLKASK